MIMTSKNATSHIYALLVAKFAGMPGLCGGGGGGRGGNFGNARILGTFGLPTPP